MLRGSIGPTLIAMVVGIGLIAVGCGSEPAAPAPAEVEGIAATVQPAAAVSASTAEVSATMEPARAPAPAPMQEPVAVVQSVTEPSPTREPVVVAQSVPTQEPVVVAQPVPEPSPTIPPTPTEAVPTATSEPLGTPAPEPTATEPPVAVEGRSGTGLSGAASVSLNPAVSMPTTEVVKVLAPSVVNISTELATQSVFNAPFSPSGIATGVILSPEGHVLTNYHVVETGQDITVTLSDGTNHEAEVVGQDPVTDIAVIKIVGVEDLEPARLGDSSTLEVGEDVIAIGHAMGLRGAPTVSKGVVSALGRAVDTTHNTTIVDLIQTDASINPDNSGGPLVNSQAEVIGINTIVVSLGQGIGFAININDAREVARQIIDQGFVRRGYLGVLPLALNPLVAAQLRLDPEIEGILLRHVVADSPAADAGLKAGDIVVSMGDEPLRNTGELSKFLISHQPGDIVNVTVLRDGDEVIASITLGERPVE